MNKNLTIGVVGFFLIIIAAVYLNRANLGIGGATATPVSTGASKYDDFAKCLTNKGAKMYGAFTCPHCADQKALFGSAFQYVNYQECTVGGKAGTFAQVCSDVGINYYPTWKFPDNTKVEHGLALSELAAKTGCTLPQ